VPIWERWTDGNLAARRLLECTSAEPASHDELFRALMATTRELRARGRTASIIAACAAASACTKAYVGLPDLRFAEACTRAMDADAAARKELAR
jgi:hypothetical protein